MLGFVVFGILNSLVDRLTGRMVEKFGWPVDLDADVKKLEGTLSNIRDMLKAKHKKAPLGWLKRLEEVAGEIDVLLNKDFVKNRKRCAPESITSWVSNQCSLPKVNSQLKICREMREIREKLDSLAEMSKFQFHETCCPQDDGEREETGFFVIEKDVLGREEDREKINGFLQRNTPEGGLEVIAIVGTEGVGTTTLAQFVYNYQPWDSYFDKKMWLSVSPDFDLKRLVGSIIEQTTGSPCNNATLASRQSKLKVELKDKKFLLVLDGVCNTDYLKWMELKSLLTIGAKGSKVIVTTRDSKIAEMMASVEPHVLKVLSEDHCCSLFKKIAFGKSVCKIEESVCKIEENLMLTIGTEIVKKCDGVPRRVKHVASLLLFTRDAEEWQAVLNKL